MGNRTLKRRLGALARAEVEFTRELLSDRLNTCHSYMYFNDRLARLRREVETLRQRVGNQYMTDAYFDLVRRAIENKNLHSFTFVDYINELVCYCEHFTDAWLSQQQSNTLFELHQRLSKTDE